MLDFVVVENNIRFTWSDEDTIAGERYRKVKIPECARMDAVVPIAKAVKSLCRNGAVATYSNHFRSLKWIFKHASGKGGIEFPPEESDWEDYLFNHFETHISDQAVAWKTRKDYWCEIRSIYLKLQRDGFIPADIFIPEATLRSGVFSLQNETDPLGSDIAPIPVAKSLQDVLPKKFLVEKDLHLDDDLYLMKLKEQMESAASKVVECCTDYWAKMLHCHALGKRLIDSVSEADIERVLASGEYYINGIHLADPFRSDGINWFLAVAKYLTKHDPSFETVTFKYLEKTPFFRRVIRNNTNRPKITEVIWTAAAGYGADDNNTVNETLNRLLGLLSPRDCSAAAAIIVSENPVFNTTSLTSAKLYTQNGKFYLRADTDLRRIILSVSKPRAGSRKVASLSTLSAKVVIDVIRCTAVTRRIMIARKKGSWRRLFLVSTRNQIGAQADFNKSMAFSCGVSLYDIYEKELLSVGVTKSMFNLYRIRCTQGILEFLRQGTVQAVASKLGNTVQTARTRYIPKWLIRRWANRRLRILQQKFILTATSDSPWMLESSDFITIDEMTSFIKNMIRDTKNGDALSEVIRQKFSHYSEDPSSMLKALVECELMVVASPTAIGIIIAMGECSEDLPARFAARIERDTGLQSSDFRALSNLLSDTARLDPSTAAAAEIAIMDKVSGDSVREYQRIYRMGLLESKRIQTLIERQH